MKNLLMCDFDVPVVLYLDDTALFTHKKYNTNDHKTIECHAKNIKINNHVHV